MAKLPKGLKKYIRKEKVRIRQEFFGIRTQEVKIRELIEKFQSKQKGESSVR
jgi:hypothetical protein